MYDVHVRPHLDKLFFKLQKKNPKQFSILQKKIQEILENPHRYKNLRSPLQKWKRVHIDSHFVLTFSINESEKTVTLEDYDHHDKIYLK